MFTSPQAFRKTKNQNSLASSERAINSQRHQQGELKASNPIELPVLFFYFKRMLSPCLWAHIQNDLPAGFCSFGNCGGVGFADLKESNCKRL